MVELFWVYNIKFFGFVTLRNDIKDFTLVKKCLLNSQYIMKTDTSKEGDMREYTNKKYLVLELFTMSKI